jgi:hypothetical protein
MIVYKWEILELFSENENIKKVKFLLKAEHGTNIVETEGYHSFSEGIVNLPFEKIKEQNLIDWLNQDTTLNEVNAIKENLRNQLEAIENNKKIDFPWLAGTFTPQV